MKKGIIKIKNKKLSVLAISLLLIIGLPVYLYWGNNAIETTQYTYTDEDIPAAFDGFVVAQVSDLHNKDFDGQLLTEIEEENPDVIVVTGDVIDRNSTDIPVAVEFLEAAGDIAPIYFVSGNHEVASGKYPELQEELDNLGVTNLDDDSSMLTQEGDQIGLIGLADPLTLLQEQVEEAGSEEQVIIQKLENLIVDSPADFNLLLTHRPELLDIYAESDTDLALAGHAHGGQIRLPFIEGLYAPAQGFFPIYTSGKYNMNDTTLIVSRGLGNSVFPLRVFNRPELVIVTLNSAE